MRYFTRRQVFVGSALLGAAGGAGAWFVYSRASSSKKDENAPPPLTADDFNAQQDQTLLKKALGAGHLPWTFHQQHQRNSSLDPFHLPSADSVKARPELSKLYRHGDDFKIVFYRLLGCPSCAKVESVLGYYDVPFEEVQINPINGKGLPPHRYDLAPQLLFTPLRPAAKTADPEDTPGCVRDRESGVFLVDSARIVAALAEPLGYAKDLKNSRISTTREWMTSHFQGASFAITNSSYRNAFDTYGYVTPSYYQNYIYRLVGSLALCVLSTYKIKPRLTQNPHPLNAAYRTAHSDSAHEGTAAETAKPPSMTTEAWLSEELGVFLARREPNAVFHGGRKPDLADVEMFGVTRVVSQHPRLGHFVKEGEFGKWEAAMLEEIRNRNAGAA